MEYSQSPWKTGKKKHEKAVVYDSNGYMLADCSVFSAQSTDELNNANACLIKHAPDMFEMLKKVIAFVPDSHAITGDCKELISKIEQGK